MHRQNERYGLAYEEIGLTDAKSALLFWLMKSGFCIGGGMFDYIREFQTLAEPVSYTHLRAHET